MVVPIHREAPDERHGYVRVLRKLLGDVGWQSAQRDAGGGEGVVPDHALSTALDANIGRGNASPRVLARLRRKIAVESIDAARKAGTIMAPLEPFDADLRRGCGRHSHAGHFAVTLGSPDERCVRRRRIQQRLHETISIATREGYDLVLADRLGRRCLKSAHHEVGQRSPL